MGVFCVNFHVQSENSKAVTKALARIVDVEALVAPPKNGWITFFDASASVTSMTRENCGISTIHVPTILVSYRRQSAGNSRGART